MYNGYAARVEFDAEDRIFTGRLAGIDDIAQKPYSGRVMLRVPTEIHAAVALAADSSGKSLNQWATEVLRRAVS